LVLERVLNVPVEKVWAAWTEPELVVQWFTPAPWKTVGCEIDLRPGGVFATVMESPEGEQFPNAGCILEVVPQRRFVWTSVLGAGFRPVAPENGADDLPFTAMIELESVEGGTRYTATAMHPSAEVAQRHAAMGFHDGWGAALDQLVALVS
jgi:uncharacterized protein YndB with AHSA1/START domain